MPGSDTDTGTEDGGVLTLAAVPIGRADDASARLVAELAGASLIAAEDTRRVRWLASSLNIELKARVVSYYDAVEARRTAELLGELQAGRDILLVTDAGTPGISDPGYRLVAAAAAAGLRVTALPGAPRPGRAGQALRRAGRGPPLPGLLRVRPQAGGDAGRARRLARRGPPGRGVPRAHQDPRGDQARHAGRTGRLGRPRQRGGSARDQEGQEEGLRCRPRRDHAGRRRSRPPEPPPCPRRERPRRPPRPGRPRRPAASASLALPSAGAPGPRRRCPG